LHRVTFRELLAAIFGFLLAAFLVALLVGHIIVNG
jgi:hypothetical protein